MNLLYKIQLAFSLPLLLVSFANADSNIDKRLNQTYQKAMESLTKAQQPLLRDAQRTWIKYRDANCAISQTRLKEKLTTCQARLARTQTKQLESFITGSDIFIVTTSGQMLQADLAIAPYGEILSDAVRQLHAAAIIKINSKDNTPQFAELMNYHQKTQKLFCQALTQATAIYLNNCEAQFTLAYMSDISAFLPDHSMQNILQNFVDKGLTNYQFYGAYLNSSGYAYRDDRIALMYNYLNERYDLALLEKLSGQPVYISSPHKNFELETYSYNQFGRYNPLFLKWIHNQLKLLHQNNLLPSQSITIPEELRKLAHVFLLTAIQLEQSPPTKKALRELTEKMIREDIDDFYLYLDYEKPTDLGRLSGSVYRFANNYSLSDQAVRFWGRRTVDGTDQQFYELLIELFEIFEPATIQQLKASAAQNFGSYQPRSDDQ